MHNANNHMHTRLQAKASQQKINRKRSRQNFHLIMQADELNFRENFKVSRAAFTIITIVLAIKATWFYTRSPTGSTRGMHKRRIWCSSSVALAITLLEFCTFLRNAVRCVANIPGLSKAMCHKHIHQMRRILAYHNFPQVVRMPSMEEEFNVIALDFQNQLYITSVIGAIYRWNAYPYPRAFSR